MEKFDLKDIAKSRFTLLYNSQRIEYIFKKRQIKKEYSENTFALRHNHIFIYS